ncbi:serine hydrolase [Erythrobacter sp. MTPC3]|uniref:serine hydrolase n=1 Tax=Erythrobacter sp. MTPC3 TaxID=3056564 RepID=UPI0036F2080C
MKCKGFKKNQAKRARSLVMGLGLATSLASLTLAAPLYAQSALAVGAPIEGNLEKGAADTYTLDLDPGDFVLGAADQITVDVSITLTGPDGEKIQTFDRPARGPETYRFTATSAGEHTLTVRPYGNETGDYVMRLVRSEPTAATPAGQLDQALADYGTGSPGLAVAVVRDGQVVHAKGYGTANLEHGIPISTDTRFNMASVGKQFTAMAVVMLADQGKLSLDDDVRLYLPELDVGQAVTLRQMLSHTSGIRDTFGLAGLAGRQRGDPMRFKTVRDLLLRQKALSFEPGSKFEYSNGNYDLAAEVVSRVTDQSFRQWVEENILLPLGMTNTVVIDNFREVIPNRASSYESENGVWQEEVLADTLYGSGLGYTTVGDLALWLDNYRTAKVGGRNVIDQMTKVARLNDGETTDYGLGLYVETFKGLDRFEHSGSVAGYRSDVVFYPTLGAGVVVLANAGTIDPINITDTTTEMFFGDQLKPETLSDSVEEKTEETEETPYNPDTFDAARFDMFEGRYEQEGFLGYMMTVTRDDEGYQILMTSETKPWKITPVADDSFRTRGGLEITFSQVKGGKAQSISAPRMGPQPFYRITSEPEPLNPQDYVGRYYSEELDSLFTVGEEDGVVLAIIPGRKEPIKLRPSADGRFLGDFRSPVWGVAFDRDSTGRATGFSVNSVRTQGVRFDRIE